MDDPWAWTTERGLTAGERGRLGGGKQKGEEGNNCNRINNKKTSKKPRGNEIPLRGQWHMKQDLVSEVRKRALGPQEVLSQHWWPRKSWQSEASDGFCRSDFSGSSSRPGPLPEALFAYLATQLIAGCMGSTDL